MIRILIYTLMITFMTTLNYAEPIPKLKAEISSKEEKLTIKISKGDEIKTLVLDDEIIYKIKKGDTLSEIALFHKKSIKKIAVDNNIKNIDLIITGKTLIIK